MKSFGRMIQLLLLIFFHSNVVIVKGLSFSPLFPKGFGSRKDILESKEFKDAKRFVEDRHYELYNDGTDDEQNACPILGTNFADGEHWNKKFTNINLSTMVKTYTCSSPSSSVATTTRSVSPKKEQKPFVGFQKSSSTKNNKRKKKKNKWKQEEHDDDDQQQQSNDDNNLKIVPFKTLCHLSLYPILTQQDCQVIIQEVEKDDDTTLNILKENIWKPHEQYGKGMDITRVVHPSMLPQTTKIVQRMCLMDLFPLLNQLYQKKDITTTTTNNNNNNNFRIFKAKVLRYDAATKNNRLGIHQDGSYLTCLIALNDEYKGGGTYIEPLGETIKAPTGHVLCHPGHIRHAGIKINEGKRYVLALWLGHMGTIEYDRNFAEEGDMLRMNGQLDQTLRYDSTPEMSSLSTSIRNNSKLQDAERWYFYSLAVGNQYDGSNDNHNNNNDGDDDDDDERVPELTSENTWLGLGQVWLEQGRFVEASDAFQNAIQMSPRNVRAHVAYGLSLVQQPTKVQEALSTFQTAWTYAETEEEQMDVLYNLGLIYNLLGDQSNAIQSYERAIAIGLPEVQQDTKNRFMAELYTNLGVAHYDDNQYQNAISAFATALLYDSTFTDASENLRIIRQAMG